MRRHANLIPCPRLQIGNAVRSLRRRNVIRHHCPLRSSGRSAFDHKVCNPAAAIAPRVQPARDARRIVGDHLRLLGLHGCIALRVRVDDVARQSGADAIVRRNVQLILGAAPEVAQQMCIRLRVDLQLLPIAVVALVVDDIAQDGRSAISHIRPFQLQTVRIRADDEQRGRIGRHPHHNAVHDLVLAPVVLHAARVVATVRELGIANGERTVLGNGFAGTRLQRLAVLPPNRHRRWYADFAARQEQVLLPRCHQAAAERDDASGHFIVGRHRDHFGFLAFARFGGGGQPELICGAVL